MARSSLASTAMPAISILASTRTREAPPRRKDAVAPVSSSAWRISGESRPIMATCAAAITALAGTPSGSPPPPSSAPSWPRSKPSCSVTGRPSAGGLSAAQARRKTGQARERGLALPRIQQVGGDRGVEGEPGEADSLGLERPHELFGSGGRQPVWRRPRSFRRGPPAGRRGLARRSACRQVKPTTSGRAPGEARRILPVASRGCPPRELVFLRAPRRPHPLYRGPSPGRPPRRVRLQLISFAPAKVASQRRAWATSSRRKTCVERGGAAMASSPPSPRSPRRR